MRSRKLFAAGLVVALVLPGVSLGAHTDAMPKDCEKCHLVGVTSDAPKVIPQEPGFLAKLFGGKSSHRGHESVSCVGSMSESGDVTGCHSLNNGLPAMLVINLTRTPTDVLCRTCHQSQSQFGLHHPSYKMDRNGDGVGDYLVRPVATQDIFSQYIPAVRSEPLASFPDALVVKTLEDGTTELDAAMPLGVSVEIEDNKEVVYDDVVQCTTCHNPHFGYLVASGEEEAKKSLASRSEGDALLRLRDYDNTLCMPCH